MGRGQEKYVAASERRVVVRGEAERLIQIFGPLPIDAYGVSEGLTAQEAHPPAT